MPWHAAKSDRCPVSSPWAVIKDDDGEIEGCHESEAAANEQLAALYATEGRAMTDTGTDVDEVVDSGGTRSPIECRAAKTIGVRFADRIITVVAAPYDVATVVPIRGRMVRESFAPGSFDGVEHRAARIKVFRDHPPPTGVVGRAAALYPSRQEGLVADLRISKTPLGDETLELADDGVLDASVGFAVMTNGEQWLESRSHRRVTRAFLDHIALPPRGQYDEAAGVLSVRRHDPGPLPAPRVPTPNLDWLQLRAYCAQYGYTLPERPTTP